MSIISRRVLRKTPVRKAALAVALLLTVFDTLHFYSYRFGPVPVSTQQSDPPQKIFIASTHWNNEAILRSHWNGAVLALARHFGVDNVFVSVYESGSWDDSKGALRELDTALDQLGVNRTIVLDQTTHQDEISKPVGASGWIDTPRNKRELRRIPYLSRLRNLSLEPLNALQNSGLRFHKVLFLNDVVFTMDDVVSLLHTNDGHYAAACALDFANPPKYYDTFALRDDEGHEPVMQTWPYFRSWRSRKALTSNQPVPVRSCWNGMVVMDAEPFYAGNAPLQFRAISDSLAQSHVEASECCLIHQDNPLSISQGVWLNPNVRVGYNKAAYDAMNSPQNELTFVRYMVATWENRLRRWFTTDWWRKVMIQSRLSAWERSGVNRRERGIDCLINEMQVLVWNGWAHV